MARAWGQQESLTWEFEYRRRYNLPPTDPRFLSATLEQIMVDCWAHRHADDPKLAEEAHDPDFDATLAEMQAAADAEDDDNTEDAAPLPAGDGEWQPVVDEQYGGF